MIMQHPEQFEHMLLAGDDDEEGDEIDVEGEYYEGEGEGESGEGEGHGQIVINQ